MRWRVWLAQQPSALSLLVREELPVLQLARAPAGAFQVCYALADAIQRLDNILDVAGLQPPHKVDQAECHQSLVAVDEVCEGAHRAEVIQ